MAWELSLLFGDKGMGKRRMASFLGYSRLFIYNVYILLLFALASLFFPSVCFACFVCSMALHYWMDGWIN